MTDYTYADRVKETTTSTGTGALTLAGAASGFVTFASAFGSNPFVYVVTGGSEWEVGIGTVSGSTLTRSSVLASSNAGSAVSFSSGSKDVFSTLPASELNKLVTLAQARTVMALRI